MSEWLVWVIAAPFGLLVGNKIGDWLDKYLD